MNNLNIPLFRAEVKDSKLNREDIEFFTELIDGKIYAIGLLCTKGRQIEVTKGDITTFINIDNSTLAINFDDMLDSQGNKIFASLREDGKGGDICEINISDAFLEKNYNIECPLLMTRKGIVPKEYIGFANFKIINVIGLKKMSQEAIIHKDQTNIEDYLNDYEDKNKYKCKTCLFVGATKKLDYICTNSLSLMYELNVFKCEGCLFYKKDSLEYENEDSQLDLY